MPQRGTAATSVGESAPGGTPQTNAAHHTQHPTAPDCAPHPWKSIGVVRARCTARPAAPATSSQVAATTHDFTAFETGMEDCRVASSWFNRSQSCSIFLSCWSMVSKEPPCSAALPPTPGAPQTGSGKDTIEVRTRTTGANRRSARSRCTVPRHTTAPRKGMTSYRYPRASTAHNTGRALVAVSVEACQSGLATSGGHVPTAGDPVPVEAPHKVPWRKACLTATVNTHVPGLIPNTHASGRSRPRSALLRVGGANARAWSALFPGPGK